LTAFDAEESEYAPRFALFQVFLRYFSSTRNTPFHAGFYCAIHTIYYCYPPISKLIPLNKAIINKSCAERSIGWICVLFSRKRSIYGHKNLFL